MGEPWHDTPPCPACMASDGTPGVAVTRATHARGEEYAPEVSLCCCACGHGWAGSNEEVEQATRADAAWETSRARAILGKEVAKP